MQKLVKFKRKLIIIKKKKKTDYNAKISEIEKKVTDHNHNKYITASEFNN